MNPFISIWSKPQATITYLVEKKTIGYGILIIILASISGSVFAFADTGLLANFPLPAILFISLFIGIVFSIPFYLLTALLYTWFGKWLGGKGNWKKMCLATAAGSLPMIAMLPISIIALLIYGKTLFNEPAGAFAVTNMSAGFYTLYLLFSMGLSIYGIVVLSKAIGYAHQFSALRGFGTVMIYMGIVFVIAIVIAFMLVGSLIFFGGI